MVVYILLQVHIHLSVLQVFSECQMHNLYKVYYLSKVRCKQIVQCFSFHTVNIEKGADLSAEARPFHNY